MGHEDAITQEFIRYRMRISYNGTEELIFTDRSYGLLFGAIFILIAGILSIQKLFLIAGVSVVLGIIFANYKVQYCFNRAIRSFSKKHTLFINLHTTQEELPASMSVNFILTCTALSQRPWSYCLEFQSKNKKFQAILRQGWRAKQELKLTSILVADFFNVPFLNLTDPMKSEQKLYSKSLKSLQWVERPRSMRELGVEFKSKLKSGNNPPILAIQVPSKSHFLHLCIVLWISAVILLTITQQPYPLFIFCFLSLNFVFYWERLKETIFKGSICQRILITDQYAVIFNSPDHHMGTVKIALDQISSINQRNGIEINSQNVCVKFGETLPNQEQVFICQKIHSIVNTVREIGNLGQDM